MRTQITRFDARAGADLGNQIAVPNDAHFTSCSEFKTVLVSTPDRAGCSESLFIIHFLVSSPQVLLFRTNLISGQRFAGFR